jgi:hypothetical protein
VSHAEQGFQGSGSGWFDSYATSRRAVLRAASAGALALVGASALAGPVRTAAVRSQVDPGVNVFPRHNSFTASPYTEISFRGVTEEELGNVSVIGGSSGGHSGLLMAHGDDNGVSFVPDARFEPTEVVTVRADIGLAPTDDGALWFGVVQPAQMTPSPELRESDNPEIPPQTFRSRPDLLPPVMTIDVPAQGTDDGYVFLGARIQDGQSGAMILDDAGALIWYGTPSNELDELHDVRVQEYLGEPVLTFAEANGPTGYRLGHYVICDSSYQRIVQLQIGNGLTGGDHHEFLLTPEGTALISCYHPVQWDTSSMGGSTHARVLDGVIQELEIETGRVLFEWHSLDEISVDESYFDAPLNANDQFDYFHHNSIGVDVEGDLYVSARHTHAIYKIDRRTGDVIWRLNGKQSDFEMGEGTPFLYQHDARMHDNGELSLFDNAATNPDDDATTDSRGLVLRLDEATMSATLEREYIHPTGTLSTSQGNMQILPNGNVFVGWGNMPIFSEFSPDGELIFNGRFPARGNSYRAYRFPWTGQPVEPPAIAAEAGPDGTVTVFASWNGATEVRSWRVIAGATPDDLSEVGTGERTGFETEIQVETNAAFVAAEALDASGNALGASDPVEIGT